MKRKFTFLMTAMALILAILGSGAEAWGQKITTLAGITSGNNYYIGATTNSTDYYFSVDGSSASASIAGTAVIAKSDATVLKFTAVTGGWTIQFESGNYLGLKSSKDNGKVQVVENAVTWTIEEVTDKGLLKLNNNGYALQKNNSGAQFGSYGSTQTDVWLEEVSTTSKTLVSVAVSGSPTKTTYEAGESFDHAGLVVTGTYDDESEETITSNITWNVTPNPLTAGTNSVSVTATVSGITSDAYVVNGLTVTEHVVTPGTYEIVPSYTFFGLEAPHTSGSHDDVTGKQNDITVVYSKGTQSNFYTNATQCRLYSGSTLAISVPEGYEMTAIAFTADGSNWVTDATKISANVGTMTDVKNWSGNANSVTITFGGTCRCTKITVTFAEKKVVSSIAVKTAPTKTTYNAGETFDPAGLVITATYNEGDPEDIAYADNESDFSFSPTLETALTTANENVTITYGGKSADQAITVNLNKLATPTNLQATNVTSTSATLTWDEIANASSYEVNVIDGGYNETFNPTTNSLLVEDLTASTEYLWSVKAIGDNVTYSDSDTNGDGNFTTLAPPAEAYTVYFDGNNHGTPASSSLTEENPGAGITLPDCQLSESYLLFLGWAEDQTATEPSAGVAGDTYYPVSNVTLFAVYKYVLTVTYVAVNGDAPQAAIVEPGSSITLGSVEDVDCNAWQFAGWSESESSTVAPTLLAGAEYTPIDNVTLYAVYKKAEASEPTQVPFVFADIAEANNWQNSHAYTSVVIDPVTITANGGGNNGKYYTSDQTWRMYNGGSVTITSTGNNITAVSSNPSKTFTINDGIASLNITATTNFKSITVTCTPPTSFSYSTTPSCLEIVATPTITPNGGEFIGSQEITLACTTEGATISYTTDDWATSSTYSAPFTITETTTIKVKATKDGMSESEEASATFTKIQVLETIQAIFDASATAGNYYVTFNNWVVSGVKGSNAYVTDGTKGFIVYKSGHGFEAGDVISGTAQLALTRYNGAAEFTNLTATTQGISVTEGGTVTPVEMNIADLGGVNTGAVITVNDVEYTGSDIFSDGENTITAYNTFMTLPTFTNGDSYNITGVYIQYNTTKEIAPRRAADIQLIVAAPTFTPEGGDYNAAQNVEIASTTAGAAIYYTLDGSDPTVESTLYSAPIELTSNTTLKAIAAKAGSVSEIATAVYTITITTVATPTFDPEGGSYFNESLEVSLDCATDGATIVYTTDNWSTQTTYSDPFTITETTTVKAKATKAAMDDSGIAEATYTKRYKVNFVVNGDGSAVSPSYITPEEALGTLPTATAPNGYTFRGWSAGDVALTDVEPTYVTAETVPTGDMTLKAVFAMGETSGENALVKMVAGNTLNNGDKIVIVAHETTVALYQETVSSSYVNKYTFDSNVSTVLANDKNWLTVNSVEGGFTLGDAANGYLYSSSNNLYVGETEQAWTLSDLEDGTFKIQSGGRNLSYRDDLSNKYWRMGGASYGTSGQTILDIYKVSASSVVYTNFCTSVTALSGNLADATTEANTAYYISDESNVPANTTATINGVLGNADASLLVIEDGGQLICGNEVSATVRKSISGYTVPSGEGADGWYIVSAPITDATASMAATGTYDLYTHDEAHYMWRNYEVAANQTTYDWFTSGYGYLYANAADTTLQFAGTVAAEGQKEVNLTCAANDATHGWNLLGNHTTHNIFFTGNNIEDGYYVMNAAGNAYESRLTSVPVAPCEGFFVKATSNTTVTLNPQPVSKSEEETPAIIETRVTETANANYSDVAYIVKGHGNNLTKISFGETTPSLFFAENGKDYAITHISDETEVLPLYFKASANANYTLNFNIDGEEFDYVVLNDMKTGAQIDLLENSSYSFDATTEDGENRFNIVFVASATESISENMDQPFAYRSGNEFIISSNGTLQIIDALGRVISTQAISGSARVNVGNLTQGTYIMRLIGDNTVRTQKIVVK